MGQRARRPDVRRSAAIRAKAEIAAAPSVRATAPALLPVTPAARRTHASAHDDPGGLPLSRHRAVLDRTARGACRTLASPLRASAEPESRRHRANRRPSVQCSISRRFPMLSQSCCAGAAGVLVAVSCASAHVTLEPQRLRGSPLQGRLARAAWLRGHDDHRDPDSHSRRRHRCEADAQAGLGLDTVSGKYPKPYVTRRQGDVRA